MNIETTYKKLRYRIENQTRKFACGQEQQDLDDFISEAQFTFIDAYYTHDGNKSPMKNWVSFRIRQALLGLLRKNKTRKTNLVRSPIDPDSIPKNPEIKWQWKLSTDACLVVRIALDPPPEVEEILSMRTWPKAATIRNAIRDYLTNCLDWDCKRVELSFTEIAKVL